jgi:HK97 family phage portal protein
MGLISKVAGALGFKSGEAPKPLPFEEVIRRLDGGMAGTGLISGVSPAVAMQVVTVMACVRAIANGCATPPLHVYRRGMDGASKIAADVPEYRILNRRPNEWQTSFEFRRTLTAHAALTGNGLAVKVKVDGKLRELIPVRPGYYQIDQVSRYKVVYRIWDEFGFIGDLSPEDVFHLPSLQWDAVKGLDSVGLARNAIGLSMAAESNQASLHTNGGRPAGILTTDQKLSPEAVDRLRLAWGEFTRTNRNGTAILDNGMKFEKLAMSGVDGQHLETRRFQVEEICRAFDVFPIMIGHSDKTATFASSEAFFAAHLTQTLEPWHEAWRQRLDEFALDGDGPLFCVFDTRRMRAGSMKDRAMWARSMAELGIYTRNELRDEEGKDPLPGLDEPLTPLNMTGGKTPPAEGDDDDPKA